MYESFDIHLIFKNFSMGVEGMDTTSENNFTVPAGHSHVKMYAC